MHVTLTCCTLKEGCIHARGYSHGLGSDKGSSEDQNRSRGLIELNAAAILVSHRNLERSEDNGRLCLVNIIHENKGKSMEKISEEPPYYPCFG